MPSLKEKIANHILLQNDWMKTELVGCLVLSLLNRDHVLRRTLELASDRTSDVTRTQDRSSRGCVDYRSTIQLGTPWTGLGMRVTKAETCTYKAETYTKQKPPLPNH